MGLSESQTALSSHVVPQCSKRVVDKVPGVVAYLSSDGYTRSSEILAT